jgi:glucosamine 6-phosphate synthetase-like amidotransferase/phosphosugar isomerase protein
MLVHLVEHFYAIYLSELKAGERKDPDQRVKTMLRAIRKAQQKAEGSYAACITAPDIEGVFAMKSGSSLYAGKGQDDQGDFIVVSSDLTSVLSKTRFLIPLTEGEGLYFTSSAYSVFSLSQDTEHVPGLTRSRLNIGDISLAPKYHYFMEQEIFTSPQNIDHLIRYYFPDPNEKVLFDLFEHKPDECRELLYALLRLYTVFDPEAMRSECGKILADPTFTSVYDRLVTTNPQWTRELQFTGFESEEAALLTELLDFDETWFARLYLLDRMLIWKKKRMILHYKDNLVDRFQKLTRDGGRLFVVASGTSYHAALTGAYLFNNLTTLTLIPANPGLFRSTLLASVTPRDVVMGISQSGETKDLVDIFNDLRSAHGQAITLVSLVNNENSTLPQEKSDFYLPLMCGPEIAVAATKSFISQLALLYILAAGLTQTDAQTKLTLEKIKYYMGFTLKELEFDVTEVALKTFLKPSMHILGSSLAGLSKEGALKIREVVLNHTEGYDAAEFKHGPNTILGKNTIYSLRDLEHLHWDFLEALEEIVGANGSEQLAVADILNFIRTVKNLKLQHLDDADMEEVLSTGTGVDKKLSAALDIYRRKVRLENYFSSYPLIFICPPDARDRRITVTQIHTHKIRGADIILIAEDSDDLKMAVAGKPAGFDHYYHKYIVIPKTGDRTIFLFQAALTLQLLSLRMSTTKMKYLNKNRVENHGVHPDVPKNVSKSITVD